MRKIYEIGDEFGVDITIFEGRGGAIRTAPSWEDWPEEMVEEVEAEGWIRKRGPVDDCWIGEEVA
jgi:hypothetical protein